MADSSVRLTPHRRENTAALFVLFQRFHGHPERRAVQSWVNKGVDPILLVPSQPSSTSVHNSREFRGVCAAALGELCPELSYKKESILHLLVASGNTDSVRSLLLSTDEMICTRQVIDFNFGDSNHLSVFQLACAPHLSNAETEELLNILVRRVELFPQDRIDWGSLYQSLLSFAAAYQKLCLVYRLIQHLPFFADAVDPLPLFVHRIWRWDWEALLQYQQPIGPSPCGSSAELEVSSAPRRHRGKRMVVEARRRSPSPRSPLQLRSCAVGRRSCQEAELQRPTPHRDLPPRFITADRATGRLLQLCCWTLPWRHGERGGKDTTPLPSAGRSYLEEIHQLILSGADIMFRDPTTVTEHEILLYHLLRQSDTPLDVLRECLSTPLSIDFTTTHNVLKDFFLLYVSRQQDVTMLKALLSLVIDRLEAHGYPPQQRVSSDNTRGGRSEEEGTQQRSTLMGMRDRIDWAQMNSSGDTFFSFPALHGHLAAVWSVLKERRVAYFFPKDSQHRFSQEPPWFLIPRPVQQRDWDQLSKTDQKRFRSRNLSFALEVLHREKKNGKAPTSAGNALCHGCEEYRCHYRAPMGCVRYAVGVLALLLLSIGGCLFTYRWLQGVLWRWMVYYDL